MLDRSDGLVVHDHLVLGDPVFVFDPRPVQVATPVQVRAELLVRLQAHLLAQQTQITDLTRRVTQLEQQTWPARLHRVWAGLRSWWAD